MWPRIVAGIFIPVGNHYFQALASTLQFVAQVCDRLWLVPATDRAFAYITYMSPPHVALVCSGPPQCAATCGWTKWPVCSGPKGASSVPVFPLKVAEFGENTSVVVDLKGGSVEAPDPSIATLRRTTTAQGMPLAPLKIGRTYHLILKEVEGVDGNEPREEIVNFQACESKTIPKYWSFSNRVFLKIKSLKKKKKNPIYF